MVEQDNYPHLTPNKQLGNCLKAYELQAIDLGKNLKEVSFRYDDERVFSRHSSLQLERHGLIEQRGDQYYLTCLLYTSDAADE